MTILLSLEETRNRPDNCLQIGTWGKKRSYLQLKLFTSLSYYKLRAGEHFIHYVFGLGSEGYGVGSVEEVFD